MTSPGADLSRAACRPGRPKVLIATTSVGAGHKSVAAALLEELGLTAPSLQVACEDVLTFTSRLFRAYYAGGFAMGMSRFPRAYGFGYWLANRPQRPGRGRAERQRLWAERLALRRFARYLRRTRPDLIVNTHFVAAPMIGRMIGRGQLDSRQIVVVTDIEVHRWWYAENVEHWYVPADHSAGFFRRWGIPDEQITVTGIPIHAKWIRPLDREKILADWRLPADRPIVILTGGTEFVCAPVVQIACRILGARPDVHLVVLAGRNAQLFADLSRLPITGTRLTPVAFTDRVNELVQVSSLMLTKGGGVTVTECLAKATPMVVVNPVPGHERGNAEYLERQGAAVIAVGIEQIVGEVRRLLSDKALLARMADSARRLYKPGTQTVVREICRWAGMAPTQQAPNSPASA